MKFNFNFPEVENAYKPSGKIGLLSIPLMLLLGGFVALGFGIGYVVGWGGIIGKNRNKWLGMIIGGLCGLGTVIIERRNS